MMLHKDKWLLLLLCCGLCGSVQAADNTYLLDFGLQGGGSYYVGDATRHVFHHVRPSYGAYVRYKYSKRWAFRLQGIGTDIAYKWDGALTKTPAVVLIDATAEFNFFDYEALQYDSRVKQFTPYMYLGVGGAIYDKFHRGAFYLPFGIGLKWNFAPRCHLNVAWQHNLMFADNLECNSELANTHSMNGADFMNNDWTSTFTVGLCFEFAQKHSACHCDKK